MLTNAATRRFITEHQEEDVRRVALRGCPDPEVDFHWALQQIEGRQKAREKLPDFYANEEIAYPPAVSLEQCSSNATAAYKATLWQGDTLADLTGGFGVDTFAFAAKFKEIDWVEPQESLAAIVRHNADTLGINNIRFHTETMETMLSHLSIHDCLYLDPSRRDTHGQRVVALADCQPNILQWKSKLLDHARHSIMVKLSPMIDIRQVLRQLPETESVHVVAVKGECKEVLIMLSHTRTPNPTIHAMDLLPAGPRCFRFSLDEEAQTVITPIENIGTYLFEPNAAVLKAGAFKSIAQHYSIGKLHPHSHLYTGEEMVDDFPGKIFKILKTVPFHKKEIRQQLSSITQANIAVRNFPLSSEELRKKLNIKDGGNIFLFGTTLWDGGKWVIVGEAVNN
ncbi:MAG: SAM-dependent methyltransferase [Bacteroidales bacterium]|nr:SAM-dependent methyltransferase [Bacteroidales bacterium]